MEQLVDTSRGLTGIAQVICRQSNIGWNYMLEGFWAKEWIKEQNLHFKNISSPNSAELLLSKKAQCCIWKIAWKLWLHRNEVLHIDHKSIHPQVQHHLDEEIQYKWIKGVSDLPCKNHCKFSGSFERLLRLSNTSKLNWLYSVCVA